MSSHFDDLFKDEKPETVVVEEPLEESKEDIVEEFNEKPKKERKTREKREQRPQVKATELHILNEENVLIFVKQVNRTKKYELKHRFYNSSSLEISNIIDKLLKEGKLQRFDYGWIGIKE